MAHQYYKIKSQLTGFCLEAEGNGFQPNARVVPAKESGQDSQLWYDDPATGTIRNKPSNFCMDIENELLVVRPFQQGDPNQQWVRKEKHIRNRPDENMVLDIFRAKKDEGANIGKYKFNGDANQSWTFENVAAPAGGGYPAPGGGYPAAGGGYPAYPGYPTQSAGGYPTQAPAGGGGYPGYPATGQATQQPRREFRIVSEMNGKVLDIQAEKKEAGAKVIMYTKHSKPKKNQMWYLDNQGFIKSSLNDMVFFNGCVGQELTMQVSRDDPRSQWAFEGQKIANRAGEVLDICRENDDNGAEVISYKYKNKSNQHWMQEFVN
jgi:hypothetical protein